MELACGKVGILGKLTMLGKLEILGKLEDFRKIRDSAKVGDFGREKLEHREGCRRNDMTSNHASIQKE